MTTKTLEPKRQTPVVEYNVSDAAIEMLREKLTGLTIQKPGDYDVVRHGIAEVRDLRVRVEKCRVELKAGALEYGRKVDSEAKRLTAMLLEIEEPLKLEKQRVDEEKDRIRREKEEAEKAKIEAELAAKRAAEEAEAARIKAEQDAAEKAERERIAAEQAAENARLAAERKALEEERAAVEAERAKQQAIIDEQNRASAKKLEEERKAIEAERLRLEREEFERQAKAKAEQEARDRLAREEQAKRDAADRAEAERRRQAAMAPDKDKLAELAIVINNVEQPALISPEAKACLAKVNDLLNEAVETLQSFCK